MFSTFFLIINGPKYVEFSGSIVCICLTSPKRPFTLFFKWTKGGEGGGGFCYCYRGPFDDK